MTTSARLAAAFEPLKCKHKKGFKHGELSGGSTVKSAIYPLKLCHTMLSSLYGFMERTPAMVCHPPIGDGAGGVAAKEETEHQESEPIYSPFGMSPSLQGGGAALFFDLGSKSAPVEPTTAAGQGSALAASTSDGLGVDPVGPLSAAVLPDQCTGPETSLVGRLADADPDAFDLIDTSDIEAADLDIFRAFVTKQLDYGVVRKDPLAKAALRTEGRGLADKGTWDEATVQELESLLQEVQRTGEKIHIGQLLGICSIKN